MLRLTLTARDSGAIEAFGIDAAVIAADLRDANSGNAIVEAALAAHGRLDGIVNAAGITVTDQRPPHTETGLADHPIAGVAPRLPQGLEPDAVARRIITAIEAGEREVPSDGF